MKKSLAIAAFAAIMASSLPAYAAETEVMSFEDKEGTVTSITAQGLTITIAGGTLVADNGTDKLEMPLSSLSSFFFGSAASVNDASADAAQGPVDAYGVGGEYAGRFVSVKECMGSLAPGVYVLRTKSETFKIAVK